jgi:hypothetical protein
MHAKRPEGPALSGQRPPLPARAMPAQVKLASPVDPVYPVRRADRGPAPITCLIHLPPPAVRCWVQVRQLHILITHHVNLVSRAAVRAAAGHHRPAQSWPARRSPSSHLGQVALGRPTRPTPGPGIPRVYHPHVPPPLIQSRRSPARYRPGPRCAARDQIKDSAKHFQARPARPIEPRPPTRTGVIIAGQMRILAMLVRLG